MVRRLDFHFAAAVVGSIAVHLIFLGVGRRVDVGPARLPPAPRTLAISLNNLHLDPELDPAKKPKPKAPDQYHEDMGDANGTGTGANALPGDTPLKARKADQDQAFLSRDPAGAGKVGDLPSPFTGPRGNGGRGGSPGLVAPPPAPPVQAPIRSELEDETPSVPAPRPALARAAERRDAPTPVIPKTAAPAPELADVKAPPAPRLAPAPVAPSAPDPEIKAPHDEAPRRLQYALLDSSALPTATRPASPEAQSDSKLAPSTKLKSEQAEKLKSPDVPPAAQPSVQVALAPPTPPLPHVTDSTSDEQPTPNSPTTPKPAASRENPTRPTPPSPKTDSKPQPPSSLARAPTGDGIAPGQPAAPADPAPQSDSESDPFSTMDSAIVHNGRLEVRRGRKVKTTRPRILISGIVDTLGLADPTVVLRVSTDATGHVTAADVLRSSGSNDLDQPCVVAMYDWWFEPPKNAKGVPIPDVFPFSISFR